jgi:DNA-binding MarR family transcriptional regulator
MTAETTTAPATDTRWLDEDEQRAWRSLIALVTVLPTALDRQLQDEAGVGHTYYMILAMLSEAPERQLRMTQLAEITSTSQSRLSHAVSRLEERGWVERLPCPSDRRGQLARLTDAGYDVLIRVAPVHVREVLRLVFEPLTRRQVGQLEEITTAITRQVGGRDRLAG